jgi:Protein of unknown function (DUF2975)
MANISNPKMKGYDMMLDGTSVLIKALKTAFITISVIMLPGALLLAFNVGTFRDRIEKLGYTGSDGLEALPTLLSCVFVYIFLQYIGKIVDSARLGDPFITANSKRLRAIGWLFLAIGMLDWLDTINYMAAISAQVEGSGVVFYLSTSLLLLLNPSLILACPLMFIMARVFDAGIKMREDVEGTV